MKFGDMLHTLRTRCKIEIRDKENTGVCICQSDSKGVDPYINYDVVEWFPATDSTLCVGDLVVILDLEED